MKISKTRILIYGALCLSVLWLVACGGGGISFGTAASIPRFAYVANQTDNTVSMYTVNATTGQLRANGYVFAGINPYAVTVDPSGKFAYVANYGSSDVSAYTINASTGKLTQILCSSSPICHGNNFSASTHPTSVTIDPSGRFAYVANYGSNDVSAYTINASTGALSSLGATVLAGTSPISVTIDPYGKFAYVANYGSGDVSAYSIDANAGTLIQIPCSGGPSCSGANFLAETNPASVTIDPYGKFAYVANYGSGDVSAYAINSTTGALSQILCGSGIGCSNNNFAAGTSPAAVTVNPSGQLVYVANYGSADVSAYVINATTGVLTQIDCGSGASCSGANFLAGTNPVSVTVDAADKFVYVVNAGSTDVSSYSINASTGALVALRTVRARPGSDAIAMSTGNTEVTYTPKFAYVANFGDDTISAYTINVGALNAVSAPVATGTAPDSIAVDPTGKFAYAANSLSDDVSAYSISASTGNLTPIICGSGCSSGNNFPAGTLPASVAVDPSGRFVYVANQTSGDVSAYTIDTSTGELTALADVDAGTLGIQTSIAAGTQPASVTVDPTGRFVYVANNGGGVSAYTINASTGALTSVGAAVSAGTNPSSVTVDPTGKFVYVANNGGGVSAYTINASTGALTSAGTSSVGTDFSAVTVDPTGRFVYVTNNVGGVSAYTINASTGVLTSAGGTVATGTNPSAITVDIAGKFVYVANSGSTNVSAYSINSSNGVLTSTGTPAAGSGPSSVITTGTIQ